MPLWGEGEYDQDGWGLSSGELAPDWFQIAYDSDEADILSITTFNDELYAGSSTGGNIYTSVDGTTWTLAYDSPEARINELHAFGGELYAATGPSGLIYKSSDGTTWTLAYDGPDTDVLALETFGSNLYHGGDSGVIRRSSDGTTWTLAYDAGSQADVFYDLEVFGSQLYAASGDSLGIIFRSSDGTTWALAYDSDQSIMRSLGGTLTDFLPAPEDTLFAGSGDQFRIYKTTDGTTWTLSYDGPGGAGGVNVLHGTDAIIYAGPEATGVLYRSTNGVDWQISYDSPAADIHAITSFDDPAIMYLGTGNGGTIYSMDNYVEVDKVVDILLPDGSETITTDGFTVEIAVPGPYDFAVAHWKMDETSGTRADEVNGLDLADNNTVTSGTAGTGRVGTNFAQFVHTNSEYLNTTTADQITFGDEDMMIACWVYFDNLSDVRPLVAKWDAPNNEREYLLDYDFSNSRFRWTVSNDGTNTTIVRADNFGAPSTDTWYFVVVWHDSINNEIGIQVNDGTPDTASHTTGIFAGSEDFEVGRGRYGDMVRYFSGRMDSVSVFSKILTSAERSKLWNEEQGLEYPLPGSNIVMDVEYTRNYSTNRDWNTAVDDQGVTVTGEALTGIPLWFPKFENIRVHWTLEEASGDRSSLIGTHILTDNNTVTGTTGKIGNAAQLTRANSEYLNATSTSNISFGDEYLAITCWVYLDSKPGNMVILSKWNADGVDNREYLLDYDGNNDRFRFAVSSDGTGGAVSLVLANNLGSPSTDTWYFILAQHDPSANVIEISVNNGTADQTAHSGGINQGSTDLEIGRGRFSDSTTNHWNGRIDEVTVYGGEIESQFRSTIYNSGVGRIMPRTSISDQQLDFTWNVLPIVDSTDMKLRIRARDTTASNGSWNESDDVFALNNGPC